MVIGDCNSVSNMLDALERSADIYIYSPNRVYLYRGSGGEVRKCISVSQGRSRNSPALVDAQAAEIVRVTPPKLKRNGRSRHFRQKNTIENQHFAPQTSSGPLSPQMAPRWLPDTSQMIPRWLPDGSFKFLLHDSSSMTPLP